MSLVPGHPSGGGTPCYHHTAPPLDTAIARAQQTGWLGASTPLKTARQAQGCTPEERFGTNNTS